MKLKHLLIVVFVIISGLPLFIGLQYLNSQAADYSRAQFAEHLSAMSLIAKKRTITAIDRLKDNTALISSRTQMRLSLSNWNLTADSAHQEKINNIIHDAKHGLTHLKSISVFDKNGQLVTTTSSQTFKSKIDLAKAEKAFIKLEPESDQVIAIINKPLLLQHKTIGYIQIRYFTDFITDLIRDRTGLGETGEWLFAVRNENGDAVFAVPLKYDHKAAFKRTVPKDRLDVPITQAMLGNELILHNAPDYLEQPVLASTRYISEMDWGLVAKINESEVNNLVKKNNKIIFIAEVVILVLAILIGIGLAFVIARPVEMLSRHTARVKSGRFDEPPIAGGWTEVKDLTKHFAEMISSLREFNIDLQRRVEERTLALDIANKKLEKQASEDPLTGLYNRRAFDTYYKHEFDRAKRYSNKLVVVVLDLDHFKQINDSYGHAVGDIVLKDIAAYLKSAMRDSDLVARLGGEEFCLVLPETNLESASQLIERVRSEIAKMKFTSEDKQFSVTCSFGLAEFIEGMLNKETLVEQADDALYQAKKSGRNCAIQFSVSAKE